MLEYCDEIVHTIKVLFADHSRFRVTDVRMDLHPEKGYMLSTDKFVTVVDTRDDKEYKITIKAKKTDRLKQDLTTIEKELFV